MNKQQPHTDFKLAVDTFKSALEEKSWVDASVMTSFSVINVIKMMAPSVSCRRFSAPVIKTKLPRGPIASSPTEI